MNSVRTAVTYSTSVLRACLRLWSLSSLELSDTKAYTPYMRARLGTTAHFSKVVDQLCTHGSFAQGDLIISPQIHQHLHLPQSHPADLARLVLENVAERGKISISG